jgi:hypothetical protein
MSIAQRPGRLVPPEITQGRVAEGQPAYQASLGHAVNSKEELARGWIDGAFVLVNDLNFLHFEKNVLLWMFGRRNKTFDGIVFFVYGV